MSDLVGNPEDRLSRVAAQIRSNLHMTEAVAGMFHLSSNVLCITFLSVC